MKLKRMQQLHVFGIRHHGPGSAKRLWKALQTIQPDCILIEAPLEAETVWQQLNDPGIKMPLALLIYNPKDFDQASYLPFAEFSPEWQAIKFGLKYDIPLKAMDLPMAIQFAQKESDRQLKLLDQSENPEDLRLIYDPLSMIANLAGYQDSERWWENTFEQEENDIQVFQLILQMLQALRQEVGRQESVETNLREAHMRKIIRKALKEGHSTIAIVCGAWHAPVLQDIGRFKVKNDNALLRGLKKVRVKSSWIPWSYERLAKQSGYRAGVISPAWYELIFSRRKETSIRWMARAARLFRKEDLNASAAEVIDAVRLADTLAIMRGREVPAIEELQEAAITVFTRGDNMPLQLIHDRLVIGDTVGKVPTHLTNLPIQKDLEQKVRSARLSKEFNSSERKTKELDLRKANHLLASQLIYQLQLLGIPWGTKSATSDRDLGSFKEKWKLRWRPDYAIRIIEASMYGNTVKEAAAAYVEQESNQLKELEPLLQLLDNALNAGLEQTVILLIPKLQQVAALAKDVLKLMEAIPVLIRMLRYGSTRNEDKTALFSLLENLLPRIFIGLPISAQFLEEAAARNLFNQLVATNGALAILEDNPYQEDWYTCLNSIARNPQCHPLLQGIAIRFLFDHQKVEMEQVTQQMALALSYGNEPAESAFWLEGFLFGSALLIIHYPPLWKVLERWVAAIPLPIFYETLPPLRRTFAKFSESERQKLLQLAAGKLSHLNSYNLQVALDEDRTQLLLPVLQHLLDLDTNRN